MGAIIPVSSSTGVLAMSSAMEDSRHHSADLAAVKSRQQATWASGDFSVVASRVVFQAELLCEAADLQAGWRVLDVATGSGNAAIAAARRGCEVVGVDYVPALLERGRVRAEVEHLDVQFVEGDAEEIPFPDASFDAVISTFGVMFAPDHRKAAAEMARVCRRMGRIALACWTPDGFIGETFRIVSSYLPPAPGLQPPVLWGDEKHIESLFQQTAASMCRTRRTAVFRYRTPEENVDFFRTYYGPALSAFASLEPERQESLRQDLIALARRYDRNGDTGPIAITADYLETVIVRA
jgi:SAM-dependent methyltransferase